MKKIITILTILSSILFLSFPVSALEQKKEIIQLDNGYYLETIIEETPTTRASNQKTAKKTGNYKNAQGTTMFSVTVTGTFTYTGSSSTCTKSVASATSKNANWKISSKSASKSGNKATAKATAKRYVDGTAVETQNCTVTLTCSSNGSLS
jgi:ABC-type Na+ efflux pump permease subunit